jgi:hypothetical protein
VELELCLDVRSSVSTKDRWRAEKTEVDVSPTSVLLATPRRSVTLVLIADRVLGLGFRDDFDLFDFRHYRLFQQFL